MHTAKRTSSKKSHKTYELRRTTRSLPADASALAWTPDGAVLAVGDQFGTIRFWNYKQSSFINRIEAHSATINSMSWSPEGTKLSSASEDGTVKIWAATKDESSLDQTIQVSKKRGVTEVSWSPDESCLAVSSDEGIVRIWDFSSSSWIGKLQSNVDFAARLSWSVDGTLLCTGRNGEVQTWRADGRNRTVEEWNVYLLGPSWSPDGNRFAAGTLNGEICIWNFRRMQVEETFKVGSTYVLRISWSPKNDILVAEFYNGSIVAFDLNAEKISRHLDVARGTRSNLAWAPDGELLAFGADRGTVHLYDVPSGKVAATIPTIGKLDIGSDLVDQALPLSSVAWAHTDVFAVNLDGERVSIVDPEGSSYTVSGISTDPLSLVSWSPDAQILALAGEGEILLWNVATSKILATFRVGDDHPLALAWSPDGSRIAASTYSGDLFIASLTDFKARRFRIADDAINLIAWTPDSKKVAINVVGEFIYLWDSTNREVSELYDSVAGMTALAWSPKGKILASGDESGVVFLYEYNKRGKLRRLEGHAGSILSLAWSPDGQVLASASDDSVKVWRAGVWDVVELFQRVPAGRSVEAVSFHQATIEKFRELEDVQIHTRTFDLSVLFETYGEPTAVNYTSAKVVLVGESNVGKSCLGLRLAQNRYEEQGTTHGMRTWAVSPRQIYPRFSAPADEQRDITLWDMGGQDEYRLIHQLFLHDTTLALIMLDPTRGRSSFNEVEEWSLRLEKQLEGRRATKLLVGTKLDRESSLIDRSAIERITQKCGFLAFFETSARTRRGIGELGKAIVRAIDWSTLSKTTRLVLFQKIRDKIELKSGEGHVVMLYSDLEEEIRSEEPDYSPEAMNVVVRQLSLQGLIVDTRLASGERALIFQVGEVERYAGSLIVEARHNPRGIPAIEARRIASFKSFPGIEQPERLPPFQERIVVECVVQLLIERNICLVHEGLLIFPSLFKETEREKFKETEREKTEDKPPTASIYYDFSGAIDNIYTTLIVRLSLSDGFGRVRMWMDGAEFERPGLGVCEIRKKSKGGGLAHLDLIFSEAVPGEIRNLFILFVEDHLRKEGVTIAEGLSLTCQSCGEVSFEEWILRTRLREGKSEITCQRCDSVNRIIEGAQTQRESNPELVRQLIALKTDASINTGRVVAEMKNAFDEVKYDSARKIDETTTSIKVLHLSDIHLTAGDDAFRMLQPLVRDLEDKKEGFGLQSLDYLVISGDLTNAATPEEYEKAYQFISELRKKFQLTPHRCIIVPGNHDQNWEIKNLYRWKRKRDIDLAILQKGSYIQLGADYGVRDERNYPKRFEAFGKFYHSLIQQEYPLKSEDQCLSFLFPDTRIQFLAFNSAWDIDEFFPERSSINDAALSKGLLKADHEVEKSISSGELSKKDHVLRIAVWHHPASGSQKIDDDSYLERLQAADVSLCLNGHVHEDRADLLYHLDPLRRIHIVGAGSVGALAKDRPPSTPRLYNLIEISRDHRSVRINTRGRRRDDGKWSGWNVWPSPNKGEGRAYYDLDLTF